MLQIIIWLGCAYLVVKAFELLAAPERTVFAYIGSVLAILFAIFFIWVSIAQTARDPLAEDTSIPTAVDYSPVETSTSPSRISARKQRKLSPPDEKGCVKELAEEAGLSC